MSSFALEAHGLEMRGRIRALLEQPMLWQIVRFGLSGLAVTLMSASLYLLLVYGWGRSPFVATAFSHAAGLAAAYGLHSRWSFACSEKRREFSMMCRFLSVSGLCFGLNNLWVALATVVLSLPSWAPVPLMVFATPVVSFLLNRFWVFRPQPTY